MNRFEFIMVMLSIIVGLGVTELLTGVARQFKAGKNCQASWIQSTVVIIILIALLQQWWESWGLQSVENWSFPFVIMLLASPIFLFIITHLLFPQDIEGGDLELHYFQQSRLIWGIGTMTVIVSTSFRPLAFDMPVLHLDNFAAIVLLILFAMLASIKRKWFHIIVVPIIFIALAVDILAFHPEI